MTGHAWSDEFSALVWKFNGIYTSKVFFQIFEEEIFRVWYSVSQYLPTCDFLRQSSVLYHVQNISWLMFHRHVNVKQRKQVLLRLHLSSWHFRWNKSYLPSCFWSRCYFCFYEISFQIRLLYIFIIFIQNFLKFQYKIVEKKIINSGSWNFCGSLFLEIKSVCVMWERETRSRKTVDLFFIWHLFGCSTMT